MNRNRIQHVVILNLYLSRLHSYGPKILLGLFNGYKTDFLVYENPETLQEYFTKCIHYGMHVSEKEGGTCIVDHIDLLYEIKVQTVIWNFIFMIFLFLYPP